MWMSSKQTKYHKTSKSKKCKLIAESENKPI